MTYLSKTLLDDLYTQTENYLNRTITTWQQVPEGVFNQPPAPGSWSAVECLEHLNSYGRYYLPAIEQAINNHQATAFSFYFKSGLLGNYFYKLMLPEADGSVKTKMRSPKAHRPKEKLYTAMVLSEFISQLEKLGQLINLSQKANINSIKVPISIAPFIKLKLGDVLLFYTAHIRRHLQQAERAMAAAHKLPDKNLLQQTQLL